MSHPDDAAVAEHLRPPDSSEVTTCPGSIRTQLRNWIAITRPEQHYKQALILIGIALASYQNPRPLSGALLVRIFIGLTSVCLIASSNYVLNGILDAATDRHHPRKRSRPIVQSRIRSADAYWVLLILSVSGLALAACLGNGFAWLVALFQVMALAYNVSPVRLKDIPYLDFLSEGLNSPLRLVMGWCLIAPNVLPSWLLLLAAWSAGATAMAAKRLLELREFASSEEAISYRRSFAGYNEWQLLASIAVTTAATISLGILLLTPSLLG